MYIRWAIHSVCIFNVHVHSGTDELLTIVSLSKCLISDVPLSSEMFEAQTMT